MISSLPRIVVVLWLLIHAVAVAQQPRYGKLQIKGSFLERLVLNDENHQPYDFPAPGAVVSVPVGRYRIAMVELKGGYSSIFIRNKDWFTIDPEEPHCVKLGAPLTPSLKVERQSSVLKLDYQLLDAEGHNYVGRQYVGGQGNNPPPEFTVYLNDEAIGSGTFQYG